MIHRFGDIEVDETLYELRRNGAAVKTEPRVFDVLLHLLRHRDRVVSKDELLDALWPGEAVSESVLPRCVAAARKAVADDRQAQRVIQTVHGRGYRFIAEVASRSASAPEADPMAEGTGEPFVGREQLMERLHDRLSEVHRGAGRVMLLAGEPGIGKTRTAEEIARAARSEGFRVFQARGFEAEGAPAFWLWAQILRAMIASTERSLLLTAAGRGAPDLAALVPDMPLERGQSPSRDEGEQARFRLFESIDQLLTGLARQDPLVLFLDDLQWADADSLLLLRFLAPRMRHEAILLLGTYRDVEVRREHPLSGALASLAREAHCERAELRGLEPSAVGAMMEAVSGTPPAPGLAESVGQMTDGNPFFIRELTRLLTDQGRLADVPSQDWSLTLPQGVRDVVGRRLDGLSSPCNEALRSAAALGREFSVALLGRITGSRREELLEWIEEALAARILVEAEDSAAYYDFTHALVRQTLYLELSAAQRLRMHRTIAHALEDAYGARAEEHLAELSYHFLQAAPLGELDRAIDYCTRAAERACSQYAYQEAARHYERALEALDLDLDASDTQRCELLLALGETLMLGGERDRGRERCHQALKLARSLDRWELFARAALGHRGIGEGGTVAPPDSLPILEEALEGLGPEGDPGLRARLLARLVQTPPYWSDMATRERLSRESYDLATRSTDEEARVEALGARWWACMGPDRLDERVAVARELGSGPRAADPRSRMLVQEIMRGVHLMRGEIELAQRVVDVYAEIAEELRQPLWRFFATSNRVSLAICQGDFARAEALLEAIPALGRGTVPYADAYVVGERFILHNARGDEIPELSVDVGWRDLAEHFGGTMRLIDIGVAISKLRRGESAGVRERLDDLVYRDLEHIQHDESWLVTMAVCMDVAVLLQDPDLAARIEKLLAPYAELFVSHDQLGMVMSSVASVRCQLALVRERADEAIALGEDAEAREAGAGLRPALLWTQSRLATALELRAGPGDLEHAAALREQVVRGAREIGSRHDYLAGWRG